MKSLKQTIGHIKTQPIIKRIQNSEETLITEKLYFPHINEIFDAINANKKIKTLILHNNEIDDTALTAIVEKLKLNSSITSLDLSQNNLTEQSAAQIYTLLTQNPHIKNLILNHNKLGDAAMTWLARGLQKNSSLESLYLAKTGITKAGMYTLLFSFFAGNNTLRILDVGDNDICNPNFEFLQLLSQFPLTKFGLQGTSITNSDIETLLKSIRNIIGNITIDVSDTYITTDLSTTELVKELGKKCLLLLSKKQKDGNLLPVNKSITSKERWSSLFTEYSLSHLTLNTTPMKMENFCQVMIANRSVTHLTFINSISNEETLDVIGLLSRNYALQAVTFHTKNISQKIASVRDAFFILNQLFSLFYLADQTSSLTLSTSFASYLNLIIQALKYSEVTTLNLPWTSPNSQNLKKLAEILHTRGIKNLNLSDNAIGNQGLKTILNHYPPLTALQLGNNSISDEGAITLSEYIRHSTTLKILYLAKNKLHKGIIHLAMALAEENSIEDLNLGQCEIYDAGFSYLVESLLKNNRPQLKTLSLSANNLSNESKAALLKLICGLQTLRELNILADYLVLLEKDKELCESILHSSLEKLNITLEVPIGIDTPLQKIKEKFFGENSKKPTAQQTSTHYPFSHLQKENSLRDELFVKEKSVLLQRHLEEKCLQQIKKYEPQLFKSDSTDPVDTPKKDKIDSFTLENKKEPSLKIQQGRRWSSPNLPSVEEFLATRMAKK